MQSVEKKVLRKIELRSYQLKRVYVTMKKTFIDHLIFHKKNNINISTIAVWKEKHLSFKVFISIIGTS